jgi:uncharacterized protein (TIGR03118 family)
MNVHRLAAASIAMASALCTLPALAREDSYSVTRLVSDPPQRAAHVDTHLVNPWGIAFNPNAFVWIANNGTGTATLYDGKGQPSPPAPDGPLVVNIPGGSPTGMIFNGTDDFMVNGQAAPFILASEAGIISAWSPKVDLHNAQHMAARAGAIYKGLAIAANGRENFLYATDFHDAKIDVFDTRYQDAIAAGKLKCRFSLDLPPHFAPFGIQNINGDLFVTYAKQDKAAEDDVAGARLGLIAVFDADGCLIRRFAGGWPLNAPWAVALAPAAFGKFGSQLLVGNFGDGTINAFDLHTGAFVGRLHRSDGREIKIDGLWGLRFGNGILDQDVDSLFFTAGPGDESHGLYGRIDPVRER